MKIYINRLVVLILAWSAAGVLFAQLQANKWTATLTVVDDIGRPVSGANVIVGYMRTNRVVGLTDQAGVFVASHRDISFALGFLVTKEGYYQSRERHELGHPSQYDYAKWNPVETIILKRTLKPIAMYAKNIDSYLPVLDKPLGFDLQTGDWIAPFGKGLNSDMLFTGHFDKGADGESDFTLTVSFPNTGDGIQDFFEPESEKISVLRSPHEAPIDGYRPQWVQFDNRQPGKPIASNKDLNRNYFFRVRTKLDENGKIVSACYGKIYGDFLTLTYYLNPTPNDRNVEFDPKKNLLRGLHPLEVVREP